MEYPRQEITDEDHKALAALVNKINAIIDQRMRLVYISALVYENARLTVECNQHRLARGFDPLPTYNPMGKPSNGK